MDVDNINFEIIPKLKHRYNVGIEFSEISYDYKHSMHSVYSKPVG